MIGYRRERRILRLERENRVLRQRAVQAEASERGAISALQMFKAEAEQAQEEAERLRGLCRLLMRYNVILRRRVPLVGGSR